MYLPNLFVEGQTHSVAIFRDGISMKVIEVIVLYSRKYWEEYQVQNQQTSEIHYSKCELWILQPLYCSQKDMMNSYAETCVQTPTRWYLVLSFFSRGSKIHLGYLHIIFKEKILIFIVIYQFGSKLTQGDYTLTLMPQVSMGLKLLKGLENLCKNPLRSFILPKAKWNCRC